MEAGRPVRRLLQQEKDDKVLGSGYEENEAWKSFQSKIEPLNVAEDKKEGSLW